MSFLIGLDAGGTKSRLAVENLENGKKTILTGGPLNICSISEETAARTAADLYRRAAGLIGGSSSCAGIGASAAGMPGCMGIGVGAAGFSDPRTEVFFRRETERWFPGVPLAVGSDAMAALYGAHGTSNGMILISGTGSVCYGERNGKRAQAGGGGHVVDDGGSGYAIGRDILAAVLRSLDGRAWPTALAELLRGKTGISGRRELVAFAQKSGKREIAALAPLITEACGRGDGAAEAIIGRAADELVEMAAAVARALDVREGGGEAGSTDRGGDAGCGSAGFGADFPLALAGSVLLGEPLLRAEVERGMAAAFPDIQIYEAKGEATDGALLMARRAAEGSGG